ncbi:hypothetical protein PZ61_0235835 [Streptomyces sp. MNU77]|uniref:limonene-1,2-epoxide hydrolase family protein n=1 Tax=Streptomyces sp. MNU77 TaxID=1573406 RepID=UPI0005E6AF0C|nr:limonene-1,2-epoxide hydrolase family protein [Streptomyces sp. MNU77]OLO25807.1 hypothetical protein PZ61_0235835 [Streptomyces sp. MNU77]
MESANGLVVRRFVTLMAEGALDAALDDHACDDIIFENVPMRPPARSVRGREAVRTRLGLLYGRATSATWEIGAQLVQGDLVMHERVDTFRFPPGLFPGGDTFVMPVATVWRVRDGRIALWRDYYDLAVIQQGLGVDLAGFGRIIGHAYTTD